MGWWNGFGPAPWLQYGPIVMIVLMAACWLLVYFLMRGYGSEWRDDNTLQILKERFARGEFDKAEYEERRRLLGEEQKASSAVTTAAQQNLSVS